VLARWRGTAPRAQPSAEPTCRRAACGQANLCAVLPRGHASPQPRHRHAAGALVRECRPEAAPACNRAGSRVLRLTAIGVGGRARLLSASAPAIAAPFPAPADVPDRRCRIRAATTCVNGRDEHGHNHGGTATARER